MYGTRTRSRSQSVIPFSGTGMGHRSHDSSAYRRLRRQVTWSTEREGSSHRVGYEVASHVCSLRLETITILLEDMAILVRSYNVCGAYSIVPCQIIMVYIIFAEVPYFYVRTYMYIKLGIKELITSIYMYMYVCV